MKVFIPYTQVRANSLIQYSLPDTPFRRTASWEERNYGASLEERNGKLTKEKTYSGTVTAGAKKRIQKAVSILIQGSRERWITNTVTGKRQKFKIGFITLTISETEKNLTAKEAHKLLLEPFLRHCRHKYGMHSYIWKAELQERGQIHYHLTTNIFIPYDKIRDYWNKLQRKAGLLDNFAAKYGHYNPNSTDVHSVYKIKNLEAYLIKYLSKSEEDKGQTQGKIWDCSKSLKKAGYFTTMESIASGDLINELVSKGKAIIKETDFCKIIIPKGITVLQMLTLADIFNYEKWRQSLSLYGELNSYSTS